MNVPALQIIREVRIGLTYLLVNLSSNDLLRYRVIRTKTNAETNAEVLRLLRLHSNGAARSRAIVFSPSVPSGKALEALLKSNNLPCTGFLYRDLSVSDKARLLQSWKQLDHGIIVGTTALGVGIDYPYVTTTIHYQQAHSMVNFVQESGRGGRSAGAISNAYYIYNRTSNLTATFEYEDMGSTSFYDATDSLALAQFLSPSCVCRPIPIGEFMDGYPYCCMNNPRILPCDLCEARINKSTVPTNSGTQHSDISLVFQEHRLYHDLLGFVDKFYWRVMRNGDGHGFCAYCWLMLAFEGEIHLTPENHMAGQCLIHSNFFTASTELRRFKRSAASDLYCVDCGLHKERVLGSTNIPHYPESLAQQVMRSKSDNPGYTSCRLTKRSTLGFGNIQFKEGCVNGAWEFLIPNLDYLWSKKRQLLISICENLHIQVVDRNTTVSEFAHRSKLTYSSSGIPNEILIVGSFLKDVVEDL